MESACGVYSIMDRASEARDDFHPFGVCVDRPDGSREFLNWEREETAELGDLHALGLAVSPRRRCARARDWRSESSRSRFKFV